MCRSVVAELQTSTAGGGSEPPGHGGSGGHGGDGSRGPSGKGASHSEAPLPEAFVTQGLEDIILFDVQGQLAAARFEAS